MGRIDCVCCQKLQCDFVSRTYTLIAPVHQILHRVSCSYETIPNAPKDYITLKNMSVGSDGGGSSAFIARTFALISPVHPVLHRVSCSYVTIQNAPKHYETHQNISLGSNGMDRVCSLRKNYNVTSWHELLH